MTLTWEICLVDASLRSKSAVKQIKGSKWIDGKGKFKSWGTAVDLCIKLGTKGLCPINAYCPSGAGSPPFKGTRAGDAWAPYGGDGTNRWVQVGTWSGDKSNTCLGHHQIRGGRYGNPGWGN